MADTTTAKRERINLRLSHEAKQQIEHAAGVEGQTVSRFILSSALAHAEKSIRDHETLVLGRQDASVFFNAIASPPAPNDKLTTALNEHTRRVDSR